MSRHNTYRVLERFPIVVDIILRLNRARVHVVIVQYLADIGSYFHVLDAGIDTDMHRCDDLRFRKLPNMQLMYRSNAADTSDILAKVF